VDLRRARIWEWLAGLFGVAVALSTILPWFGCARGQAGGECPVGGSLTAWEAFAVTDVVLTIAGLGGIAALVLTVTQRTPALPLAVASIGAVVALVAATLAAVAVVAGPAALVVGTDAERLVGSWIGAPSAVGLVVATLGAIRDERVPDAAPGMEGAAPHPRTLTLSGRSAAGSPGGATEGGGTA
jgi:hypothetical protein